ncbi:MAG TPA: hypothetical protein VM166_01870 [Gemmatimonadaceae bacterium]|nr:hypothetical protein [Gemmatimonadaceae bacterium]
MLEGADALKRVGHSSGVNSAIRIAVDRRRVARGRAGGMGAAI